MILNITGWLTSLGNIVRLVVAGGWFVMREKYCFVRLVVAGADLLWEKSTAGWLVAGADLVWEKSTTGWLADKPNEQSEFSCFMSSQCWTNIGIAQHDLAWQEDRVQALPSPYAWNEENEVKKIVSHSVIIPLLLCFHQGPFQTLAQSSFLVSWVNVLSQKIKTTVMVRTDIWVIHTNFCGHLKLLYLIHISFFLRVEIYLDDHWIL